MYNKNEENYYLRFISVTPASGCREKLYMVHDTMVILLFISDIKILFYLILVIWSKKLNYRKDSHPQP